MNAPTWNEWARYEWPGLTDEEISTVLWNCTAFPLGTVDEVEAQFRAARDDSGGDMEVALTQVHEEMDRIMTELREAGQR